jgi:hypothetical protein
MKVMGLLDKARILYVIAHNLSFQILINATGPGT